MTACIAELALPPRGEVEVRYWSLELPSAEIAMLRAILSLDERLRADRFVRPDHSAHFVAAHGRLRQWLGERLGIAPEALVFEASAEGKPRLARSGPGGASGLRFNLSHSGGWAVAAIATDVEVGIDIEAVRPVERAVARRFFAPEEIAALEALPAPDWLAGFYRCWTRKEAVLKASGHGLGVPLDDFAVSLALHGPARILLASGPLAGAEAWSLLPFAIAPDIPGAVVVASDGPHRIGRFAAFEPSSRAGDGVG